MKALSNNVGNTVYLAGYDSNVLDMGAGKCILKVFKHSEDAQNFFELETAAVLKNISLLHGTLTKAMSIPLEVDPCIDIFLIVPDINIDRDSFFIKCKDLEHLQTVVSKVTSVTEEVFPIEDEDGGFIIDPDKDYEEDFDASLFLESEPKDIEDLYILYGYEIELHYTFDSLFLDESLVEESKNIYNKLQT